ncbi:hypothetical protein GWI33_013027 [Rhynchophorus ferrugineus]|uniref:Protein FAM60A n=1 Tax=Rhynchophorus ferrugineus TaxID=354439 RepID=A0A834I4J6_RHYFE|nr:hypothetical protein GWI33_013027 [Rhynchophorus ferrugineus]
MFSFHKPKVYRSSTGCCICKAKSSSSRFTDSKKYEDDFLQCFKLSSPRQGEICNACVLLVKRWKKLPVGSDRNWRHVVDARAGPGMKSFTKLKTKNKKTNDEKSCEKIKKKKHFEREYSPTLSDKSDPTEDMDIGDMDFLSEDVPNMSSSLNISPGASDNEDNVPQSSRSRRRKGKSKRRSQRSESVSGFIDLDYWRKESLCCGTIFRGLNDEIMVDPSYLRPCPARLAMLKSKTPSATGQSTLPDPANAKVYSDSGSDSGYDDSSNQGMAMSPDCAFQLIATRRDKDLLEAGGYSRTIARRSTSPPVVADTSPVF